MRAVVYSTRDEALAAQREIDSAHGYPRVHVDGEYELARPGRAAERLASRGIRTDHHVPVIAHPAGRAFAVAVSTEHASAEELDDAWWRLAPRGDGMEIER